MMNKFIYLAKIFKKNSELNIFMPGGGAIGCEIIKNMALREFHAQMILNSLLLILIILKFLI